MTGWLLTHKVSLGLALLALASSIGVILVFGWFTGGTPAGAVLVVTPPVAAAPPRGNTPSPAALAPAPPAGGQTATVYVTGAVLHEGVYTLPADARILDALQAAGGPAPDADLERINLAARVHDADQIAVPRQGPASSSAPGGAPGGAVPPAATAAPAGPIDINRADAPTLATLPGIGPVLAERIVAYRAAHGVFASIDAIQDVPGIGPKLFAGLQGLISAEP